ncbi:hypothetical protein FWD07_02680 [Candidatus Saccharibacteria bacterium]|nr:hypothetical protein [Candidatus Saccharibacteria bacterium]
MNSIDKPSFNENITTTLDFFQNPKTSDPFRFLSGNGCVLISAPHSVEQLRLGKPKLPEYQTGILALLLHHTLNCPTIIKTSNQNDDANFDMPCAYKSFLTTQIPDSSIKYLIDLHQMSRRRKQMITICTGRGANIHKRDDITDLIKNSFKASKFHGIHIDDPFDATYENTVSSYISRTCRIPCFQLEINSQLVHTDHPQHRFYDVLNVLSHIIQTLNNPSASLKP